jgi:hypothetical protein
MENRKEKIGPGLRWSIGGGHLALGVAVGLVVPFLALPARYLPVDVQLWLVGVLLVVSGAGLLAGWSVGPLLARIASAIALFVGLTFLTALLWTASYLKGIYGDLGRGASAMFVLVAFTVLPYLVIYPAVALVKLRPRGTTTPAADAQKKEGTA